MNNILITYYSKTGHTEQAVTKLAEILGADIEKIIDLKNRQGILGLVISGKDSTFKNLTSIQKVKYNPKDYRVVILATPTWASAATPAILTYIDQYKGEFKNVAFLVCQAGTCNGKVYNDLESSTEKSPFATVDFTSDELQGKQWIEKLEAFAESIKHF